MERKRFDLLNIASLLLVAGAAAVLPFEVRWGNRAMLYYYALGFTAAFLIVGFFFRDKLWKRRDIRLLLLLLVYFAANVLLSFGFYPGLIAKTKFEYIWLLLFGLYFVMQASDDPERLLRVFVSVAVAVLSVCCLCVIGRATAELLELGSSNLISGIFYKGRLWAYTNPNIFAFYASTLFMLSLYGRLEAKRKLGRVLFCLSLVLGGFSLGLTNCRTCVIGCAFSVGLIAYVLMLRRFEVKKDSERRRRVLKILAAAAVAAAVSFAVCVVLCMSTRLYRWTLMGYACLFDKPELMERLRSLTARRIRLRDVSVIARVDVWGASLAETFGSLRTAIFGRSQVWSEYIAVNGGEYSLAHSHNSYLEILRRQGLIGFAGLMGLTVWWGKNGVRMVFDKKSRLSEVYLMGMAAGILIIGFMEQMPFPYKWINCLGAVFFLICGYCVKKSRG